MLKKLWHILYLIRQTTVWLISITLGNQLKQFKYLNLKKYNFTKLENGLIKTINSMK